MSIINDIINKVLNENSVNNITTKPSKINPCIKITDALFNSFQFILTNKFTIKKKYKFIKQTLENMFIEKSSKDDFILKLQKVQKIYFSFSK